LADSKQGNKVRFALEVVNPVNRNVKEVKEVKPESPIVGLSQETSEFLRWCKSQLNPVARTGGINVHEFMSILQSIPLNEASTIMDICVDTLGISTAIDPRKFATEYVKRRRAENSKNDSGSVTGRRMPSK